MIAKAVAEAARVRAEADTAAVVEEAAAQASAANVPSAVVAAEQEVVEIDAAEVVAAESDVDLAAVAEVEIDVAVAQAATDEEDRAAVVISAIAEVGADSEIAIEIGHRAKNLPEASPRKFAQRGSRSQRSLVGLKCPAARSRSLIWRK